MTNSQLLKIEINESGYKVCFVAKQLNIGYQALLNKINNLSEFKASEISILCELLNINIESRENIFFTKLVD